MSKIASAHCVLVANRPSDGVEVFLDFEGDWNENIREAVVAHTPDEGRALEDRGAYDASRNLVVEPRLIEVHEAAVDSVISLKKAEAFGQDSLFGELGAATVFDPILPSTSSWAPLAFSADCALATRCCAGQMC